MISKLKYDKPNDTLTFTLKTHTSIANAIRRTLLMDLPSYCLNITSLTNHTAFIDEFIKKRISLIPLYIDDISEETYKDLKFKLNVKGELNKNIDVTTKELKPSELFDTDHLIAKVRGLSNKVESLKLECGLVRGTSYENSKWAVINVATYEIIEVDEDGNGTFEFLIEGNSTTDLKKQFKKVIKILKEKINNFNNALDETESSKITLSKEGFNTVFNVENESHTLGNLITRFVRGVEFIGYNKPHPLNNNILIKINSKTDPKKELRESCTRINKVLDDIVKSFK